MYTLEQLEKKSVKELKEIGWELNVLPDDDRRRRQSWIDAIAGVNPPLLQLLETSPTDVQAQESPIIETVEASPAAENVQAQELPIESKFGCIVYPRSAQGAISQAAKTSPGVNVDPVEEAISQAVKTSPGVNVDPVEEAISQAVKTSPGVNVDPVEDFLPECSDCFGDGYFEDGWGLVKFCQCEPKSSCQKTQSAIAPAAKKHIDDDSEPLEVSLDSFCEWAPCPDDWYEPSKVSEVSELSPTKSSITSDFFIPIFDAWCDRSKGSDEPPDTGIFARLPKPKPPKFPPKAASQPPVNRQSTRYPETIPKLFHRVAAGSSTQPARSPPGGDAMS